MHTHKDTHIHAHKIQTCKHSLTHARAVMYIIPETYSMYRACMTLERLRLSPWNPTTHISTSPLWCLWLPTHTHILQHWHPLPILALCVSWSHTHSSSITLNILQYSKAEIPWHNIVQLSVKCCVGLYSKLHYCHYATHTQGNKSNLVMISWNLTHTNSHMGRQSTYTLPPPTCSPTRNRNTSFRLNSILEASWRVEVSWGYWRVSV